MRVLAYFTAVGVLFFGYHYLGYVAKHESVSPLALFIDELSGAWMAAVLFPFVARLARRHPIASATWTIALPVHLAGVVTFSVVHTSLFWLTRTALYPLGGLGAYHNGPMAARYPMEFFLDVIAYVVIVSILYLFDRQLRATQLEATLTRARLENLQLQLQPHFLFNALNAISSIVYDDPRRADGMIVALSDLLRATVSDSDRQLVSLQREVETLDRYLAVMRGRFEDRLMVNVEVDTEVLDALVPHFLLQPLIENSIKHGAEPYSNAIRVALHADRTGPHTRLRIRDFGRGAPGGRVMPGTGLRNTAERLNTLYGSDHALSFDNCADGGLVVTVKIPFHTSCAC
jgi:two-component system, LytTR family, sensor kinase